MLGLPPLAPEALPLPRLDVSWVRSDLAVGGKVDPLNFARLRTMGIESVVDLRAEDSDDPELLAAAGIRFLHLPMPNCEPLTQRQMGDGSAWVASERRAGRKVLLHCQHGIGRSVMLVTAVLHARWDRADRRARPDSRPTTERGAESAPARGDLRIRRGACA